MGLAWHRFWGQRPLKSLVIVSSLQPDATGTGKAVVWSGLWRYLVSRHRGAQITYMVVGRSNCEQSETMRFEGTTVQVVHIREPTASEQAINLADAVWHGRPFQEAAMGGSRVREELRRKVAELAPDLLLIDTYRLGVHLTRLDIAGKTILYMEDLFSVRYERMVQAIATRPALSVRPLGNFATVLPPLVGNLISRRPWSTLLLRSEARRVRRTELEAPHMFDLSLLVNPDEVALLSRLSGSGRIKALPPLIQLSGALARRPSQDAPRFVFLGALNVPHNEAGLTTFLIEALPELLKQHPNVIFDVVGRGANEALLTLGRTLGSSVRFLGYIDDLDILLAESTAMLVPLIFGSGIKIKVLEALGRGVPVVATSFGAEGLARSPDGKDGLFVADKWGQFLKYATDLIDADNNRVASTQAREHFLRHYGSEAIAASYDFSPDSVVQTNE